MYASVSARDADSTRRRGDPDGLAAFAKSATAEPTDSDHPARAQDGNANHRRQHLAASVLPAARDGWEQQAPRLLVIDPTGTAKCADRVTSYGPPELDGRCRWTT